MIIRADCSDYWRGVELDPWQVEDTTDWPEAADETRGSRAKKWLLGPDGALWLRKRPHERQHYRCEITIEAFAARLSRSLGFDTPVTHVCVDTVGKGVVVRTCLAEGETFSEGSELLSRVFPNYYDREDRPAHTVAIVHRCLVELESEGAAGLVEAMLRMLAFDAWIGNGDRHQANWGIVYRDSKPTRLAPPFDTSACLGRELADAQVNRLLTGQGLDGYIERCPSGFGNGTTLIKQLELLSDLRRVPEWPVAIASSVNCFERALEPAKRYVRNEIPDDWLSPERRELAALLIDRRLDWLRRNAP